MRGLIGPFPIGPVANQRPVATPFQVDHIVRLHLRADGQRIGYLSFIHFKASLMFGVRHVAEMTLQRLDPAPARDPVERYLPIIVLEY
jgi:hypothetical protein